MSHGETHNGWIAFWEGMLGHTGTTYRDIPCIEKIDVASSESFVAEDYFVDPDDEHDIRQFIADCDSQSKTPYIFRFAATDYYVNYLQRVVNAHVKPQVGWAVHECSVVVDFDIIDLGFIGDSEALTILPVVSNPIDIFVDIDVPDSGSDSGPNWWMILLVILCTILVLWIIYKLVLPIASYSSSVSANRKLRKLLKEQKKKDNANGKEGNDP